MKQIVLKSLSLVNFKGEKERTTTFNSDITTICGANGLGKSRHFDAFLWLLFGKDAQERKDYEIRTIVNGEPLHKCECSVTGVLLVNGEQITLKRSFVEDWVKPRGCVELVFKGNRTECWWNESPVNVGEYAKRVEAIVDADVFKMITNPAFFTSMKWNLQREHLFQLAGNVTDEEIAKDNKDFALLIDRLSGKSLLDFKREIAAKKSRLKTELDHIQPRIDQTHKMMPESEDFDALKKDLADVNKEIESINVQMQNVVRAQREKFKAQQDKQSKINNAKAHLDSLFYEAKEKARKDAQDANQKRVELVLSISSIKSGIRMKETELETAKNEIKHLEATSNACAKKRTELLDEWTSLDATEWNGSAVCPTCGQPLPDDQISTIKARFNAEKAARLEQITYNGQLNNQEWESVKARLEERNKTVEKLVFDIECANEHLAKVQNELDNTPEVKPVEVRVEDVPGYADIKKSLDEMEAEIDRNISSESVDSDGLKASLSNANQKRDDLMKRLAAQDQIIRANEEIESLEKEGKDLAQQIADIEKTEFTIQNFTKARIDECTARVNKMFQMVTFRLFDYTIDGNPVETCVALVNGVPFGTTNRASQINAGLDIINTLCKHYGVQAPIFLDNAESVNEFIHTESQIIRMVVTSDSKLIVK